MGGFEVIDERYRGLYERAVAVLEADERVLEVRPSDLAAVTAARVRDALSIHTTAWLH